MKYFFKSVRLISLIRHFFQFRQLRYLISPILILSFSCTKLPEKPAVSNIKESYLFDILPSENCHAATLAEVMPNKLMAAWFGGSCEGAKDVGIFCSFYDGTEWSVPQFIIKPLVSQQDTLPCWNPVLFISESKRLYLFYKVGKNPREWFGAMIKSTDQGETWSAPEYLPDGILGPIKNKPIETEPGVILCGSSTESIENNQWRVHLERYTEASGEWEKIPVEDKNGFEIIQPTFLVHSANKLQILCRSKHSKIISSWSDDNGKSWKNTDSLNVVNSNSGIDALTLSKRSFLLVNNPLPRGTDWFHGRNVLDLEYSTDGIHWEKLIDLENKEKGEFSYPAIIQTSDGRIHILYTFNREYIKHVKFELIT